MVTRNRTFSFPYFASYSSDYQSVFFDVDCECKEEGGNVILDLYAHIGDPTIKQEIQNQNLGITALLICSNTLLRKAVVFDKGSDHCQIRLLTSEVDEKLRITLYVVAIRKFYYTNPNFSDVFEGVEFLIEKGNHIGEASTDVDLYFHHYEDKGGESIFTRSFKEDLPKDAEPYIQYRDSSIDIVMPKDMYRLLNSLDQNSTQFPLIHSTFLVPALTQAISSILSGDVDFNEDNQGKKWYTLIVERLSAYGNIDEMNPEDSWKFAQLILNKPVNHLFAKIENERETENERRILRGEEEND